MDQFADCWEGLEDPRTGNAGLHDFHELLMIALCTVLCGGQSAVDMGLFARAKEPFLRGFLSLANGLPSHDTFSRLFRLLDPPQFQAAFQRFMARFSEQCQGVVAIDGKVLRARSIRPAASPPCTWSAPGAASKGWCWRKSPPPPNPTRSLRCRNC
jgi:DDE_Tnp_1-associated